MTRRKDYDFEALIELTGWSRTTIKRRIRSKEFPDFDYWGEKGRKYWDAPNINRYWKIRTGHARG